jgi:hypothetical protein
MALNVYTSLSNNPPREDGNFFETGQDGAGTSNGGSASDTDASTPRASIAPQPQTDQSLVSDPMLTYGAAEFVARGGVIAYGQHGVIGNMAARLCSSDMALPANRSGTPDMQRANGSLAKDAEYYGGGDSLGGSDDEDGFGGSDAGGGSSSGSDWSGGVGGDGNDFGTPSWATPSTPAGEQPSTSDNDSDLSGSGTNTNASAAGGSDPSGGNGDSGDVGDANNANGSPPAAGRPNTSANPLDNCDPTATGTTEQDANGTYHRTNTVNVRASPYFGTVNPDGTPYTGMITVSDRSGSFNTSSSSTIGGLRPVSTNTGGAPNEYQAAMDAATRLLGKPQGSITREEVLGVILQLRNAGANPASNLTMRDRQGLSSMFMAVYTRGNSEGVIDASYVPREMVTAGLGAMAFGGSNPRMPRPSSPTGPILPGTRGSRTAVPIPGSPTAETAQLLAAAQQPFRGQVLTNAGRAATKHPEYFGFESTQALRAVYRTDQQINTLASQSVQQILASGTRTTGAGGRYPNGWITYTLPDGRAASWQLSGEFIGFRGVAK